MGEGHPPIYGLMGLGGGGVGGGVALSPPLPVGGGEGVGGGGIQGVLHLRCCREVFTLHIKIHRMSIFYIFIVYIYYYFIYFFVIKGIFASGKT